MLDKVLFDHGLGPLGMSSNQLTTIQNLIGASNPTSGGTDTLFNYIYALAALIGATNPSSGDLTTLFKAAKLLDTKLGTSADAAGVTTLFARLAQIAGYTDTLETKVGTNTDAAGTTTLFARLAQIAGYTDQVEGYVDTLESNLGTTGDAASASGSAHAKLVDIKNYLVNTILSAINTRKKPRGPAGAYGSFSTNETTYQTALNISGQGRLVALRTKTSGALKVRLTIDGYIVSSCKSVTVSTVELITFFPTDDFLFTIDDSVVALNTVANGGRALLGIEFKTSLKIELAKIADTAHVYWYYEIQ